MDTWINGFGDLLQKKFPQLRIERSPFRTLFTYDIDVAFKYLGRGAGKSLLAAGKDMLLGKWKEVIDRSRVLWGRKSDPWDVYEWIRKELNTVGIEGIFFFLTAGNTKYDHNVDVSRNEIKNRVFAHTEMAIEVGIHPSFRSSEIKGITIKEKKRLGKYLARAVTSSRQHFLKFRLPDTYRELVECGIARDFSMAFPEISGFRAGTSRPFPFYDLLKEQEASLMIYPSCWMDATYINYGNQSADKAEKEALEFLETVKAVGGYFIPIFHNNVLEDERYRSIHHLLLDNIADANKR
ncbi:MAG TPA: polysaccharide deacetylase family protein [Ginsengibacter sp.]|nr:polysaccharide deacetylase family protein [Ginsengibacter sp.]